MTWGFPVVFLVFSQDKVNVFPLMVGYVVQWGSEPSREYTCLCIVCNEEEGRDEERWPVGRELCCWVKEEALPPAPWVSSVSHFVWSSKCRHFLCWEEKGKILPLGISDMFKCAVVHSRIDITQHDPKGYNNTAVRSSFRSPPALHRPLQQKCFGRPVWCSIAEWHLRRII